MANVCFAIDDELLSRIDARANERGRTRSEYLERSARADLMRESIARVRAAAAVTAPHDGVDSTEYIRRMRDERSER
jgi:predicted transcriptional regulator